MKRRFGVPISEQPKVWKKVVSWYRKKMPVNVRFPSYKGRMPRKLKK